MEDCTKKSWDTDSSLPHFFENKSQGTGSSVGGSFNLIVGKLNKVCTSGKVTRSSFDTLKGKQVFSFSQAPIDLTLREDVDVKDPSYPKDVGDSGRLNDLYTEAPMNNSHPLLIANLELMFGLSTSLLQIRWRRSTFRHFSLA